MKKYYTIELNSREALVTRVALRRMMEERKLAGAGNRAWKDVHATAEEVLAKLSEMSNVTEEPRYPEGLCGDRTDHGPHLHASASLGTFWCHADQARRLPFAMERRDR